MSNQSPSLFARLKKSSILISIPSLLPFETLERRKVTIRGKVKVGVLVKNVDLLLKLFSIFAGIIETIFVNLSKSWHEI